jgi:hypothetical protein
VKCVLLYTSLHVATLQNTAAFSYRLLNPVQYLTYSSVFAALTSHRHPYGFCDLSDLLGALNGSFETLIDIQLVRNRIVNTLLTKAGCYLEPVESVITFTQGFL